MAVKLIIGLGGTGSRVVEQIAQRIRDNGERVGNDETACIVIDADPSEGAGDEDGLRRLLACTPMRVRDCVAQYADFHPEEWLPQSPALMEESMMNGFNSRAKARLTFLNFMKSRQSAGLIDCIDRLASKADGTPVHVQVVTSLCGNFGSGTFLQTALWLRRLLAERGITIVDFTGFFLLPEVLIRTVPPVLHDPRVRITLQANAYAALRELNGAFQVRRNGLQMAGPFVIDDLFDASREAGRTRGIYDYVYLIGDANRNGISCRSLEEYEAMLADGIFARNHHPVTASVFTSETDAYRSSLAGDRARYLSMGAAKAVYPTEEIKDYCVLRGIRETVLSSWLAPEPLMEAAREQAKAAGMTVTDSDLFLRAFGDLSARMDPARSAALAEEVFLDTVNEIFSGETSEYSDKTADFLEALDDRITDALSGIEDLPLPGLKALSEQKDRTVEELLGLCEEDKIALRRMLDAFDVDSMTHRILRQVMPPDRGEVNLRDPRTVCGYLAKTNRAGKTYAVHPLAARYLLYHLIRCLKDLSEDPEALRELTLSYDPVDASAVSLGKWNLRCDPVEVLMARRGPLFWRKRGLQAFAEHYPAHIKDRQDRVLQYRKAELLRRVCEALIPLLEELAASYKNAFREIRSLDARLADSIAENAAAEDRASGNTLRVYATEGAKVKIFEEVNFSSWEDHSGLNEWVLNYCYGNALAVHCPAPELNSFVIDRAFGREFLRLARADFEEKIDSDPNRRDAVYLDVFAALRKQSELAAGVVEDETARNARYCDELRGYRERLTALASPFLETEDSGLSGVVSYLSWCLPSDARQCYLEVDAVLGKGVALLEGCSENQLICYRSAGGFEAAQIPTLNEFREESHYLAYRVFLDHDPNYGLHLDRSWPQLLPYLTPDGAPDGD